MKWLYIISDILSVITISLCLILKVPQIFLLIKSGKASGLSLKYLLLELSSFSAYFRGLEAQSQIFVCKESLKSLLHVGSLVKKNTLLLHEHNKSNPQCQCAAPPLFQKVNFSLNFRYTVTMMHNYSNKHALLSYMEYPIIVIQEYILIGLVFYLKNYKLTYFFLILLIYVGFSLAFAYEILNKVILAFLLPLTIPVGATSKIIQLYEIISKKNAESVSVLTWFLSFFTNVTRIYTVYLDSADTNLLINLSVSSFLSGSVMLAAIYFKKVSQKKVE